MFSALVVESNQKLSSLYSSFLSKQGYSVSAAYDAATAINFVESHRIDIILCELQLPGIDGFVTIQAIREIDPEVPIIVLTSLDDLRSKQRAYGACCDDYLTHPVDLNELALRMSAVLRRVKATSKKQLTIGNAVLDRDTFTVVEGSSEVFLPPKEFLVLFKLCSSPDRIFTRRDIMNDVWGIQAESNERTVDVHIKRLRKRFKNSESFRIDTVRGMGYKVTPLAKRTSGASASK